MKNLEKPTKTISITKECYVNIKIRDYFLFRGKIRRERFTVTVVIITNERNLGSYVCIPLPSGYE